MPRTLQRDSRLKIHTHNEFRIDMYTLLYLKWITSKDLLYSTGNSTQYYVTT